MNSRDLKELAELLIGIVFLGTMYFIGVCIFASPFLFLYWMFG